jgi:hypothetical protein
MAVIACKAHQMTSAQRFTVTEASVPCELPESVLSRSDQRSQYEHGEKQDDPDDIEKMPIDRRVPQ